MREILDFPKIDTGKIEAVKNLIDSIAESLNGDCSNELVELEHITGKQHTVMEFAEYWGWTDLDTLAEKALVPEPPCVCDLAQGEVEEIVSMIKDCMISGEDGRAWYYTELLHKSLPLTNVTDYIMSGNDAAETAEKMVAAAKSSVIML